MKVRTREILVHPEDLTYDWLKWMSDAQLNTLGLHPVGGESACGSLQQAIYTHGLPQSRALRAEANARGITVEYEAHTMGWLLPRSLFAQVPDWFRMNEKGARVADFNMCASNPDALDYVARRARLLAELLDTGSSRYYYWLDDVAHCTCHCPACRSLSASDQQLRILNAMLSGLRQYDRQAKLCYIAYNDAMAIPRHVEPADGIFLEYAPFRRNPHRPINDPDCPENVSESKPLRDLISFFGMQDAKVLDYWMDNSLFSRWTKPPKRFALDEDVMRRDVDFYHSLGFTAIASFGCYLGPDYQALYGAPSLAEYGGILTGV